MNNKIILRIFLLILSVVIFCIYWLKLGFNIVPLREGFYLSTSFLAAVAGIFALKKFGLKNNRATTLVLLTGGISFWFFGETLFDYYQYIVKTTPYPSVADIFYILAYPLLFFGLLNEIRTAGVNWRQIHKPVFFLLILVALFFAAAVFYFGIYKAYNPQENFLTNAIAMGYGIGDLFLIIANILVLVLVWEFRGGRLSRVWLIMFLSFVATLIADILFAIYTDQYEAQIWFYKSLLDTFWMTGYLLFAYALFEFGFSIQDIYQKIGKLKNEKQDR